MVAFISLIIRGLLTLAIAIPLVIGAFFILPLDPKLGEWLWWASICLGISLGFLFVEAAKVIQKKLENRTSRQVARERICAIARWLWPTTPSKPKVKPTPDPVVWESWQGQVVKVIAGPFKGRQGVADGIGWGKVQVTFPSFHRVWMDGAILKRLTGTF